jgi:hypothetical protein
VWWYTPVIPAPRKLSQENYKFEVGIWWIPGQHELHSETLSQKNKKQNNNKKEVYKGIHIKQIKIVGRESGLWVKGNTQIY